MPSESAADAVPIIIFARTPAPGACKTRLIPRYGPLGAARIYRALVRRTLRIALAAAVGPVTLCCTPAPTHPFLMSLRRHHDVSLDRQCSGDLGRRMAAALGRAGQQHRGRALLVGTDAADLCAQDLRDAAQSLLSGHDAVLQPAQDGGYVLIALARSGYAALRDIDWSSGRELAQTRGSLERRGMRVALLEARADIDHPRDLRRARRSGLRLRD